MIRSRASLPITGNNLPSLSALLSVGALFFFAHPYHWWERGTNENTNDLVRQYLHKSMGFELITEEDYQEIMDKLNNRPPEVLGFRTRIDDERNIGNAQYRLSTTQIVILE